MPILISDDGRVYSLPETVLQDLYPYLLESTDGPQPGVDEVHGQAEEEDLTLDALNQVHIRKALALNDYRLVPTAEALGVTVQELEQLLDAEANSDKCA